MNVSGSVVLYKAKDEDVCALLDCVKKQSANINFVVVDNSPDQKSSAIVQSYGYSYFHLPSNPGFGAAHNHAIKNCDGSDLHFIINPDVTFDSYCFEKIIDYMSRNHDVVCVVPKVVYPNGEIQRLCKLLPSPVNLLARRFFPALSKRLDYAYEMHWFGYDRTVEIPYASGCFMAIRGDALVETTGFDERFFMYLEDTDLSRRLLALGKVIFFPDVEVVHAFAKQSYKNRKLMLEHIKSAFSYFNKWGWFFDSDRKIINGRIQGEIMTSRWRGM